MNAADLDLKAEAFYDELVVRNRGFISGLAQQRLRAATVLIAGCGSTGGAAVEPLARLGIQDFLLADNGAYELNNLNRQNAYLQEIGHNKAQVCARRLRLINPAVTTTVRTQGISAANVDELVRGCDVVVDGVDVTEPAGWVAKYLLHEASARRGRPVISGYDMAGTQYVRFYDYQPGDEPFDGRISRRDLQSATTWDLLRRVVPMRAVPIEMLDHARSQLTTHEEGLPQLVHASLLFGAVACRIILSLMEGAPIRRHTVINVDAAARTPWANLLKTVRKPLVVALALRDLAVLKRNGNHAEHEGDLDG